MTIADVSHWLLLAQEAAKPAGDAPRRRRPPGSAACCRRCAVIMVLFYFLILRPQKAKDQQFRSMVDNLKEKDRVVTIGGIHGVVTNVAARRRPRHDSRRRVDRREDPRRHVGDRQSASTDEETPSRQVDRQRPARAVAAPYRRNAN